MEYLLVSISMLCLSVSFVLNKFFETKYSNSPKHLLLYTFFAQLIIATGFFFINGCKFEVTSFGIIMAIISGVASIGYAVLGVFAAKYGKISIFTMFLMIGGMFLPYFFGIIFLNETISVFKILGMVVLLTALICNSIFESRKIKTDKRTKPIFWILCIVAFILNGGSSIVTKIHQTNEQAIPTFNFLTLSSLFTAVFVGIAYIIFYNVTFKKWKMAEKKNPLMLFLFSLGFAILSGGSSLCLFECAKTMPAVIEYPFVTGGTTIITALFAWLIFKEKQDKKSIICLCSVLIGTILFIF